MVKTFVAEIGFLVFGMLGGFPGESFTNAEPYPLRGHDGGTCKKYPESGEVCSDFVGGMFVYEWSGISMEEYNAFLGPMIEALEAQVKLISTASCLDSFYKMGCLTFFPPCSEDGEPRQVCKSTCEYVVDDVCKGVFDIVRSVGKGYMITDCDGVMGDVAFAEAFMYYEYLNAWEGGPMYAPDTATPQCADLSVSKSAACKPKQCAPILMEYRTPTERDPQTGKPDFNIPEDLEFCRHSSGDEEYDCERCDSWCGVRCLYPEVYPESTYTALYLFTFLPGILSGPLNLLVIYVELKKLNAMKRKDFSDRFVLISAIASVWLFVFDAIPSALFGQDMRCNGESVYSWRYDLEQEHAVCKLGKLRLHVLQAIYFCVVGTLYKVDRQLTASLSMKKYTPSLGVRAFFALLIIIVPSILALLTMALDADQLYELSRTYRVKIEDGPPKLRSLQTANRLRYAFTCGPRFSTPLEELVVIHFPLMLAGITSFLLSCHLLYVVFGKMGAAKTGSSAGAKSKKQKNTALAKLAINMIRFAFITTFLTVINVIATVLFIPQSTDFGLKMDTWEECSITGVDWRQIRDDNGVIFGEMGPVTRTNLTTMEDFYEHCGRFDDFKPDAGLLILIAISNGFPALAFGFIFSLPALKQLRTMLKNKVSKIAPSTGISATSSTG